MHRIVRTAVVLVSAMGAAASLAVTSPALAAPPGHPGTVAPRAVTAPPATTTTTQTAVRVGGSATFPAPTTHSSGGAVALTEAGRLQRYANLSRSPRPAVTADATGRRFAASAATSWLPVVASTPVAAGRPGVVRGWNGLDEFDNQTFGGGSVEPPDQGLCAGRGQVLELINIVAAVYAADGTRRAVASLNDFFHEPSRQFLTDPSCVYDAATGRFLALELTLDVDPKTGALTQANWLDLAVSRTSDPAGGWDVYRVDAVDDGTGGTPAHRGCPCLGDYPHLGTDAHGVYLTTNEYPFSADPGIFGNNFNGAQVYALAKAAVVAGRPSVPVLHLDNTRLPDAAGAVHPGFTLWPAQGTGTSGASEGAGTMYFVSSTAAEEARPADFTGHSDTVGLWWLSGTSTLGTASPSLSFHAKELTVGGYGVPPLSNQKPGPVPLRDCLVLPGCLSVSDPYAPEQEGGLDSSDSRVLTAVYVNGHVLAGLDTAMSVAGELRAGVAWFDLTASRATSTVSRRGYLGTAGQNLTYPAVAVDTTGHGYVGMTLVGDDHFPSAAYTRWPAASGSTGGGVHVALEGRAPQDGFCEYLFFNCGGTSPAPTIRPRWGDYGGAAWDGTRFVIANEDIAHACDLATFQADPTCGGTRTTFGNFSTRITVLR